MEGKVNRMHGNCGNCWNGRLLRVAFTFSRTKWCRGRERLKRAAINCTFQQFPPFP